MTEHTFEQTRWSLADLMPAVEGPEFDQVLADLEAAVGELEAKRDTLSPEITEESFLRLVALVERIANLSQRLGYYGGLWFYADTQDQDALAYRGRMEKLLTDVQNRMLFFDLWWKGLDDEAADRLLAVSGDNVYYLESLRRFKPHTLSEPEEKVINLKDVNGVQALVTVYDMVTSDFTYKVEIDGEVKELTRDALMVYARDPRPEVRAAAYQELYRVFGEQSTVLGQIYQLLLTHLCAQPAQRYPRPRRRHAPGVVPPKCQPVPTLVPPQGWLAGHGKAAAIRHLCAFEQRRQALPVR
jgi:oligoendopeptidase F